jgi:hypothetical protein
MKTALAALAAADTPEAMEEALKEAKEIGKTIETKKSSWHTVESTRPGSMADTLRNMKPGEEWWEVRKSNQPKATTRETALYIDAKRAGALIEVTRHRALSMISDDVTHLIRIRKKCNIMQA